MDNVEQDGDDDLVHIDIILVDKTQPVFVTEYNRVRHFCFYVYCVLICFLCFLLFFISVLCAIVIFVSFIFLQMCRVFLLSNLFFYFCAYIMLYKEFHDLLF